MIDVIKVIDSFDIQMMVEKIKWRQERYGEELMFSVGVVLLNFGDRYVQVSCLGGEWHGKKGDLEDREGVPTCPNGHPLFENTQAPILAIIERGK